MAYKITVYGLIRPGMESQVEYKYMAYSQNVHKYLCTECAARKGHVAMRTDHKWQARKGQVEYNCFHVKIATVASTINAVHDAIICQPEREESLCDFVKEVKEVGEGGI